MSCDKKLNLKWIQEQHANLCMTLNIEEDIQLHAWQIYLDTSKYLLAEGDPMHWLCCSLYIAWQTYDPTLPKEPDIDCPPFPKYSKTTQTPTVIKSTNDSAALRNGMNLSHLLRSCGLSNTNFIDKLKYWNCKYSEQTVQIQIRKLEHKYCLNLLVFNYYKDIFMKIYRLPPDKETTHSTQVEHFDDTSLHNKHYNCRNIFDMGWLLFLCVKYELPEISFELMSLQKLIICCIEVLYRNVLENQRFDLINMTFTGGVPKPWLKGEFNTPVSPEYCVIEALCRITPTYPVNVHKMKYGTFQRVMDKLLKIYVIFGLKQSFLGLTANITFWSNFRTLNARYDKFLLNVCEFDERVLLNYDLIPMMKMKSKTITEKTTKAENISENESLKQTIFQSASDDFNIKHLQSIINLKEHLCVDLRNNTPLHIHIMFNIMRIQFCATSCVIDSEQTIQSFNLAHSLYYYFLNKISLGEQKHKPNLSLNNIFKQPIFNSSLMTCCLELVLIAHNTTTHKFPWILECCNIQAFNFHKIIEIVVRHHDGILTPLLIRHLSHIEEMCLDTLVWRETSILWPLVNTIQDGLPSYYDVEENVASERKPLLNCDNKQVENEVMVPRYPLNALHLFLRKLYHLAWERLDHLCSYLRLKGNNEMLNIWLIFQYTITHKHTLMLEHHLDQLIICSIYIFVRKNCPRRNILFADIIKYYRYQRQAERNIYRKVLLKSDPPIYSDIIGFYNLNYLPAMSEFVFNQQILFGDMTIAKTPDDFKITSQMYRLSPNHYLYISPLIKNELKDTNYVRKFEDIDSVVLKAFANGCRFLRRPNILKRIND